MTGDPATPSGRPVALAGALKGVTNNSLRSPARRTASVLPDFKIRARAPRWQS